MRGETATPQGIARPAREGIRARRHSPDESPPGPRRWDAAYQAPAPAATSAAAPIAAAIHSGSASGTPSSAAGAPGEGVGPGGAPGSGAAGDGDTDGATVGSVATGSGATGSVGGAGSVVPGSTSGGMLPPHVKAPPVNTQPGVGAGSAEASAACGHAPPAPPSVIAIVMAMITRPHPGRSARCARVMLHGNGSERAPPWPMMERVTVRIPAAVAVGGAVAIGVMTAVQARINGQLGVRLGDGFAAAVISFGSGLLVLCVLSASLPQGRRGWRTLVAGVRERRVPIWMLCGGVAGALSVATQSLAVGIIGVALFTVGVVAGQTVSGLLLDRSGIGPAGTVAVTPARVAGGALALLAAGVSLAGGVDAPALLVVLPFLVGAGIAWQSAVNGRLRQRVGTPLTATLVNFIGGTAVLGVAELIHTAVEGPPAAYPPEPWLYVGGVIGVTYIFLAAALVPYTGVLLLSLGTVVGQVVTSVAIDAVWPASATPALWQSLIMSALAISSVVVAAVPWTSARGGRGPAD